MSITDAQIQGLIAVVSGLALIASIISYRATKKSSGHEHINYLTDRLYELDKLLIQFPCIQKFLYERCSYSAPFFVAGTTHDELYFQVKGAIYYQLNYFDEIFTVVKGDSHLEEAFELEDWENYIVKKMRHPLFKEVFNRESSIWGTKFRAFVERNAAKINEAPDPETY